MSKFNKRKVWISSLIALSLLVNVLSASAEGINSTVSEISNVSESETQQKSESPIVSEDITKRGENEKHFLCEDGSYIAVAYADAVHEKNAQNEWIEIDNTLVSENNRIENNSESFHTSFSETANPVAVLSANAGELLSNNVADNSESQLVSIESGEHRLSWSLSAASMLNTQQAGQLQQQGCVLENTSNDSPVLYQSEQFIGALPAKHLYQHSLSSLSEAEIKNNINSQQEETNYQKTIATKAVSSVLYQNAFGDKVDLQYTVAPSKIKEDVILRESSAFRSYTMNVDTNGLTAVKSENNTVEFLKTDGTSVFTIQTPYMYDSADECSYDIDIIIEQTGNIASVTYTPDSNWINSGERVYPITIDPSVQAVSSLNRSSISDTYVHEGNGSCCSGINPSTHDRLYIGRKGNRIHRAYFKINTLPTIVSGSYINQAEVYAQCYNGTTTSKPFSINKVTSSWNDSTLGWSPQPASTDIQGGVERNTNYNVIQFNNCRAAIASLYNGNMANNGFMIHYTSETDNDYNSIYSYENANTSGCPYMVIYYTSPAGIATGTYYIRNKHSGHYLDAENKGGSGTNVLQYAFNGSTNQQWKIERQSNGLYVLKAVYNTGLALDVNNASESNSANIQVYNFNNSSAQQWYIIENNDGGYRILSRCSNGQKCVTVQNASTASGANVFQYDYTDNAGENDEWYLEKVKNLPFNVNYKNSLKNEIVSLVGSGIRRVGCNYTSQNCVEMVISYDSQLNNLSNRYNMPKAILQTILFRELWCVGADDDLADGYVLAYYSYQQQLEDWSALPLWQQALTPAPEAPIPYISDSSTGLGQIFAKTGINANNYAISAGYITGRTYDITDWKDVNEMWQKLFYDNSFNLKMMSLVILHAIVEKNLPSNTFNYTSDQYKKLFTRYNASLSIDINDYGRECYQYFLIFNEYNQY